MFYVAMLQICIIFIYLFIFELVCMHAFPGCVLLFYANHRAIFIFGITDNISSNPQ